MATLPNTTKVHFTHPNHTLLFHPDDNHEYTCGGCKTSGSGSRFRCQSCNFDLHEYCVDCPETLTFSTIHHHHLALVLRKPEGARLNDRICDICRESVEGMFYRCEDWDFDAHPLCTKLPKDLRHAVDSKHSLKLQKLPSGGCAVCKMDCSNLWVYGCEICRVNIHLDCMLEPYNPPPSQQPSEGERGTTTSRGIPSSWASGSLPYPGGGFPWNCGYSGRPFGNNYGYYGRGGHYGHGGYGYATPYAIPDYPFAHPNHGVPPAPASWNCGYSGGPFGNNYGKYGTGGGYGHGGYGYATPYAIPDYPFAHPNHGVPPAPASSGSGGKTKKSMFALVGRLTVVVMSSAILGFPIGL